MNAPLPPSADRVERPAAIRDLLPGALVVMVLIAVAAWIGRRLWFFSDDWNIFTDYTSGHLTVPFNGHLSAVPVGIYQLLFHTVGMGSYWPYRIVGLVGLAILGFQVCRWCGARLAPAAAAVAVAAVMWNSSGTTNVLFPFLINFSLPIAALVAIWWHLDRLEDTDVASSGGSPTVRRVAVALWLAVALATSGLGVMAAVAVLVELAMRRAAWRTWLAWAVPVVAWLAWWVGHRGSNEVSTEVTRVVPYFLRMLWGGPSSVAAGNTVLGAVLGVALVVWIAAASLRARRLDPRVAGGLAAALAFAGLTALTRQDTFPPIVPDEPRYAWTIGAYLVLAAVAQATAHRAPIDPASGVRDAQQATGVRGAQVGVRGGPALWVGAALAVVVLVTGAVRLVDAMGEWTDTVAGAAPGLRSNLYAAEAVGAQRMSPDAVIAPLSFLPVSARGYLEAVSEVGSPLSGATAAQIGGRPDQRLAAESLFFDNVPPEPPQPVPAIQPGLPDCSTDVDVAPGGSILVVSPAVTARPGGAAVDISRFASSDASGTTGVDLPTPPGASRLNVPEDAAVGTGVVVPYRIRGTEGSMLCPG